MQMENQINGVIPRNYTVDSWNYIVVSRINTDDLVLDAGISGFGCRGFRDWVRGDERILLDLKCY